MVSSVEKQSRLRFETYEREIENRMAAASCENIPRPPYFTVSPLTSRCFIASGYRSVSTNQVVGKEWPEVEPKVGPKARDGS